MPKNVFTLKREVLKTLGISVTHAADWRMRKVDFDGITKIQHDVMNLTHNNKVEIIHEHETLKKSHTFVSTGYCLGK